MVRKGMKLKLIILGSGTYQPEPERNSSAYLIKTAHSKICFDFGRGAIERLYQANVHPNDLEAIFISHWHPDHISDLLPLLHIILAPSGDWPKRKKPLKIFGPRGTIRSIDYLKKATLLDEFENKDKITIQEIKNVLIKGYDWQVNSYKTFHNAGVAALSYRLKSANKIFAYSGDTAESAGLKNALKDADVALVEAGWPEKKAPKIHLSGSKAGQLAKQAKVKKLIITHVSPYYLKNFNPLLDAKTSFGRSAILAKDLMSVDIS